MPSVSFFPVQEDEPHGVENSGKEPFEFLCMVPEREEVGSMTGPILDFPPSKG
jgi:hypothetical protein